MSDTPQVAVVVWRIAVLCLVLMGSNPSNKSVPYLLMLVAFFVLGLLAAIASIKE